MCKMATLKMANYCLMQVKKKLQNATNGSLMKVESIAECLGAFCNTFDRH